MSYGHFPYKRDGRKIYRLKRKNWKLMMALPSVKKAKRKIRRLRDRYFYLGDFED